MQIRTKLTLQFIIVVILIILFGFSVVYYSSYTYIKDEFYQRLENKAKTSAEIFISVQQIDSTMQRILDRTQRDKLPYENISIYNDRNFEIYTSNDSLDFDIDKELFDEIKSTNRIEFEQGNFKILGIVYNDEQTHFVIFAGAMNEFGENKLIYLRNMLATLFVVIISIAAYSGWIYAGRALRPLSKVVDQVNALNADKLDTRLNLGKNNDEIGQLIKTFNTLLDRIENAFKLQKLFVSGASHELKNPLASITSQLQVSLINERSVDEYKGILGSILEDIKNLNRTTHDLMEYARLNYENVIQLSDLRIDDLLWFSRDYFQRTRPDYKVNIHLDSMPEDANKLLIKGNEALLTIAFTNLIDNACKFSANTTCNVFLLFSKDEDLLVRFTDTGIGLSKEESALVFEPFYRANSTSETKGNGIGLALTKKIIQLHNASISLETAKGKGTSFELSFNHLS
ncbi:sensor histidine kinase [Aurantibacillus circumpalustris]|uniref:sensor histidine kinase n=1 Tax=Aurantibacillus circumpalustris TaxID=3036359 RepID=UPI00295C16AC|nr:HAMP domain-containing sensor histidine kinase [Aurantibacillus circumpalustris]